MNHETMYKPRRIFIRQAAFASAALSISPAVAFPKVKRSGSDRIIKQLTELNDEKIEALLASQLDRPGDR